MVDGVIIYTTRRSQKQRSYKFFMVKHMINEFGGFKRNNFQSINNMFEEIVEIFNDNDKII